MVRLMNQKIHPFFAFFPTAEPGPWLPRSRQWHVISMKYLGSFLSDVFSWEASGGVSKYRQLSDKYHILH